MMLASVAALLVVALMAWSLVGQRAKRNARAQALDRLGFRPCPGEGDRLRELIAQLENNRGYRYEVGTPMRLEGGPAVYFYTKTRHRDGDDTVVAEEEMLFPLKRPSLAGLVLVIKPSSLAAGLATRLLGAVATGAWDAQPDDLQRLELPRGLEGTNLVGALGPPGASLYDLVDASTLSVVQGLGDAGAMLVRFRDAWCSVGSADAQIPFRVEELIAHLRPLL